jgi:hypothetical protein
MEKRSAPGMPHRTRPAMIICPRGEQPVDAFAPEHQPGEMRMWDVIEEALDRMDPEMTRELRAACLD